MGETSRKHPIALKRVVHSLPGMELAPVRRGVEYRVSAAGRLTIDVYYPSAPSAGAKFPLVILVTGYPDVGVPRPLGCAFKDTGMWVSMAQLIARSGMAAAAYTSSEPAQDVHQVLDHVTRRASALGVDGTRLGLWAASGHVPVALSALVRERHHPLRAAALSNGYTLDLQSTEVEEAARTYRFVNAASGKFVTDLRSDVPLFVVRSGRDEMPGINAAMDRFIVEALKNNLPVTVTNQPAAPHGFELNDDTDRSRHVIAQMLRFLRFHLTS
jgi:hypothetical protein